MPRTACQRGSSGSYGLAAACALALVCSVPVAAASASGEAQTFRSIPGRFSVQLPAAPERGTEDQHPGEGPRVEGTTFSVQQGVTEYRVEYYDLPRFAAALLPDGFILRRARDGLVGDVNGRMLSSSRIERRGRPAITTRYEIPGERGEVERALLVLSDRRLYLAAVRWPGGQPISAFAERFFRSFSIWGSLESRDASEAQQPGQLF
jgi:hypothetical protein